MFKKISKVLAGLSLLLTPFVNVPVANAVADTCTWTGAVNANWNNAGNWTCSVDGAAVPENGDDLEFPESASNKSMTNDIVALETPHIDINGTGYTFAGNGLTITGSSALSSVESATIDINITYSGFNPTISATSGDTLTITGTTTFSAVAGEVNIGAVSYTGTVDFVDNINGDAGSQLIAAHGATAIVRGATNTFTAGTVGAETNATFECRSTTCFGDNANNIYVGGGMIELRQSATYSNDWETSATTPNDSWIFAYENITINGAGTVNDAVGLTQETASRNLQFLGNITNNSAISLFAVDTTANVRMDSGVSGTGGFSIGDGSFRLAGNNTYSGTNTINSGAIVTVTNANGLGTNAGATNVLAGGSLQFDFSTPQTVDEPILLNGTGVSSSGALVNVNESTTLSNTVTLNGDTTVKTNSGFLNFDGVIDGSGNLTLDSLDTTNYITLGVNNNYTGTTTVYDAIGLDATGAVSGNLVLMGDAIAYPSASNTVDGSLTMTPISTDKPHWDQAAAIANSFTAISGDGSMLVDGAGSSITFNQNTNTTYAGNFSGSDGPITKSGTGTLTHTGGCSAASKLFTVQQGTLVLNTATNTCQYAVASGATLKGSGSAGTLTFNNGSTFSPGNSPGCMNVSGLNLNNGATFVTEIAGSTACTGYDQTVVSGVANITGSNLTVVPSYTPADGTVFTILNAGTVSGTFNGVADGATITANGIQFRVNYTATTVTLTKLAGALTTTTPSLADTGRGAALQAFAGLITIVGGLILSSRRLAFQHK